MKKATATIAICVAMGILLASPAQSTWPGENGTIVMLGVPVGSEQDPSDCSQDDPYELYTMQPDGSGIEELANVEGYPSDPTWSRDGNRIAFALDDGPDGTGVYTVAADGTDLQPVIDEEADETGPAWAPDGARIAYQREWRRRGGANIFTISPDGTGRKQLTTHRGEDVMPAWSPNGRRIAFASTRGGDSFDIYTMTSRGSDMKRLTRGVTVRNRNGRKVYGGIGTIAWSPDGRWIMYSANKGSGASTIYKMRRNGSDTKALEDGMTPVWSPDDSKIFFKEDLQSRACTPELKEMKPNGTEVRTVETPNNIDIWAFDWQAL